MLKVSKLSKSFTSGDNTVQAVRDVSFEVPDGEFASIVGQSGSGKSTLLSLLGALDVPNQGSIEVDGRDITALRHGDLIDYRCRKIGFVFQGYNLVPNLSALENVMLPMEYAGETKQGRRDRAQQLLDEVGLKADKQLRKPGRLSGGEQQRVAIARALANKPSVVLADEPTGNLDSKTGKLIFDLLHSLARKQKTTIIVVTHDLDIAGKTDKTYQLSDGRLTRLKK